MTALVDLPDELLVNIISFLLPRSLERLAQIFNRRLTALCLPFWQARATSIRNAKRLVKWFGKYDRNYKPLRDIYERYHLRTTCGAFSSPPTDAYQLDYLRLNGTLDWLTPLDDYTRKEMAGHTRTTVTTLQIARLLNSTQKLGLTLPPSFLHFISDSAKHEYFASQIPSTTANFFMLSRLGKLNWDLHLFHHDREEYHSKNIPHAYLFTFYSDQQGCGYWNLYLDTCGRHAVLSADSDIPDESHTDDNDDDHHHLKENHAPDLTDVEQDLGLHRVPAGEVSRMQLQGTDFEEWLVHLNYWNRAVFLEDHCREIAKVSDINAAQIDASLTGTVDASASNQTDSLPDLPPDLREYLLNVCTERGTQDKV